MLKVSIIIPVYNNHAGLLRTLNAVACQRYSLENVEVIVVDNGSEDNPEEVVSSFIGLPHLIFLQERRYLQSPYSARNRGFEISRGEILILLDSTCAPVENWLESGVKAVEDGADLVGGNVSFAITESSTIGEIYDSLSNIRMKESIREKNAAKTTNLFIHRRVIDTIGPFPEGLRSGGDLRWTYKATKSGFRLVYSHEAKVVMLPRGLRPLVKKQFRVGKGQPSIWVESNNLFSNFIKKTALGWLPPNPRTLKKWIQEQDRAFVSNYVVQLYMVGWLLRIVNASGNLTGLFHINRNRV